MSLFTTITFSPHPNNEHSLQSIDLKKTIKALRKGNQLAGFQLYQAYSKACYNSILRIVNREDIARDLLQETFIQAFEQIHRLENELAFGSWLKRIGVNLALGHLRQEKNLSLHLEEHRDWDQIEEEDEIPELPFETIRQAIDQLPAGCRLIFQLYYLEEYKHQEIAEELNISLSNSKTQLRYAKRLLREQLKSVYETR